MRSASETAALRKKAAEHLEASGFSRVEIAVVLGVSGACVTRYMDSRVYQTRSRMDERAEAIAAAHSAGQTLEQIGSVYGITRERVRQILRRLGVSKQQGGIAVSSKGRRQAAAQMRDQKSMERHGCSHADYQMLLAMQRASESRERGPLGAFARQKASAQMRGIPFNFTLWGWWTVWRDSGKWEYRGRGRSGYCMARIADAGAYELGNVRIVSNLENIQESYLVTPADKRRGITRDELGLTNGQRRIYEIAKHGVGPKAIAERLGLKAGSVATQLVSIRRAVPSLRNAPQ